MTAAPQDVLTEVVQAFTDVVEGYVEATQKFSVGWGTLALINAPHDRYDDSEHPAAQRAARPGVADERPRL